MPVRRVAKAKKGVVKQASTNKSTAKQDKPLPALVHPNEKYLYLREAASPNWRDVRVQEILHSPGRAQPTKQDDQLTREIYKYRVLKNHLSSHSAIPSREIDRRLTMQFGPLHLAHLIHQDSAQQMRTVVEARILAGQDNEDISVSSHNPPEVISLYHDVFFDVRDRLTAKDWISTQVIGQVFQVGDQRTNQDLLAKYFGYFGGPLILEAVLYGVQAGEFAPTTVDGLAAWIDSNLRFKLKTQAAVLMTVYTPNRFDFMSVIGGYAAIAGLEIREKSVGGEDNQLTVIMECVREINPISLGDSAKFTDYSIDVYANKTVAPRVSDRPTLANNQLPAPLKKYTDPNHKIPLSDRNARANTSKDTAESD